MEGNGCEGGLREKSRAAMLAPVIFNLSNESAAFPMDEKITI